MDRFLFILHGRVINMDCCLDWWDMKIILVLLAVFLFVIGVKEGIVWFITLDYTRLVWGATCLISSMICSHYAL